MCQKQQTVLIFLNKYLMYLREIGSVGSLLQPLCDNHNESFEYNRGKYILVSVPFT